MEQQEEEVPYSWEGRGLEPLVVAADAVKKKGFTLQLIRSYFLAFWLLPMMLFYYYEFICDLMEPCWLRYAFTWPLPILYSLFVWSFIQASRTEPPRIPKAFHFPDCHGFDPKKQTFREYLRTLNQQDRQDFGARALRQLDRLEYKFLCKRPADNYPPEWCSKCLIIRPARAYHCDDCKRCIIGKDRHFEFIDQCAHFKNMKFVLLTLVYNFQLSCVVFAGVLYNGEEASHLGHTYPSKIFYILLLYFGFCVCYGFFFSYWAIMNLLRNLSHEERYDRSIRDIEYFSHGFFVNIQMKCGKPWLWLVPVGRTWGDGLYRYEYPDTINYPPPPPSPKKPKLTLNFESKQTLFRQSFTSTQVRPLKGFQVFREDPSAAEPSPQQAAGSSPQQEAGSSSQQQAGLSPQPEAGSSSQQQAGSSSQHQAGWSSQQQAGSPSQQQAGPSPQQEAESPPQQQAGPSPQPHAGSSSQQQTEPSPQAQAGSSSQQQTAPSSQHGATNGTTPTVANSVRAKKGKYYRGG